MCDRRHASVEIEINLDGTIKIASTDQFWPSRMMIYVDNKKHIMLFLQVRLSNK